MYIIFFQYEKLSDFEKEQSISTHCDKNVQVFLDTRRNQKLSMTRFWWIFSSTVRKISLMNIWATLWRKRRTKTNKWTSRKKEKKNSISLTKFLQICNRYNFRIPIVTLISSPSMLHVSLGRRGCLYFSSVFWPFCGRLKYLLAGSVPCQLLFANPWDKYYISSKLRSASHGWNNWRLDVIFMFLCT